ncbi:MAG TPA: M3 family metallopeptidase [Moraxellaceae bacterium]|mgnify:FL=1|nr:M3 family metallopeptidase [Moraxellaceae bacterium]
MSNPLLESYTLPPFDRLLPEHVVPGIDAILAENRAAIAKLGSAPATWEAVPAVLEQLQDRLDHAWAPVSHLNAVMNSEAWREAYNGTLPKLAAYSTELGQNEALFTVYEALEKSRGFADFNQAQQQSIRYALRDFRLSGIGLPADKKKRFADIQEKFAELSSGFADSVLDATQAWGLCLDDDSRLGGLPDSAKGLLAALAQQKDQSGYRITLDAPSYLAIMMHAEDRGLREAVYTAYVTRASDQGPQAGRFDNSARMVEILRNRQEMAALLGYANYAEVSLVPKMAETPRQVIDFLNDLALRTRSGAERELAELRAFARDELGLVELQSWDVAFASEKLKEKKYAISQEQLRPYFPAPKVINGMLKIAEILYGLEIHERHDINVWHDDVTYYEISEHGEVVASFYLDPYARENKRGGAWMADCRVRRRGADGKLQKPVAFLTCNFSPPVDGKPALLTHDEVTTLFHEFGHGLHHMLTRIEVAAVSGINGVAWDAVELPSQFHENWCWEPRALELISGHVETGAPLPEDLLDKMLAAKNFQSGLTMLRQLEFALFDMELHQRTEFGPDTVQQVLDSVRARVTVLTPPAFNRFQHGFSHIFAGGYAAGYYSYKWAEVLSADAFSRFEEEGVMNPETGRHFRETILAQGGSRPAQELFAEFRGRAPAVDALMRHSGL